MGRIMLARRSGRIRWSCRPPGARSTALPSAHWIPNLTRDGDFGFPVQVCYNDVP